MVEQFDKKILLENISFLIKEKGMRVGELETKAGVSLGYISRMKEGGAKPGIDFIMNAARAFGISLDALLMVDLTSLTPTEKYIITFLQKLEKDTNEDKLDWKTESEGYLNERIKTSINGFCEHPLFSVETFMEETDGEYSQEVTRTVFTSHAFDVHTAIAENCYNLRLKNGVTLYLMSISKSVYRMSDTGAFAKEVWVCPDGSEKHYLCGTKDSMVFATLIENLYSAVGENAKHPKIDKEIKSAIDAFMKDDMQDEVKRGPRFIWKEEEEDIPF